MAHLYRIQGKDAIEVDALVPGEIGAVAKVEEIAFDCVLHDRTTRGPHSSQGA